MNSNQYRKIQSTLSLIAVVSLGLALTFTVEYYNLASANDLSEWGRDLIPPFTYALWGVSALALTAKAWGWVVNRVTPHR